MQLPDPKPKSLNPPFKMYLIGAILVILQALFITLCGTCMKYIANDFPFFLASFYQYLITLILIFPILLGRGLKFKKTNKFPLYLVRSLAGFGVTILLYLAMQHTPLVNVMALNNTAPLFIPIIIFLVFKTPLKLSLLGALFIGYLGILLILQPKAGCFLTFGAFLALISGVCSAIAVVSVRRLTMSESHEEIIFYYLFISLCLSFLGTLLTNSWVWPNRVELAAVGGMGVFLVFHQLALVKGLSYAPASRLAPFMYFAIIFSGLFGWVLFQEKPGWLCLIGMFLIVLGAIASLAVGDAPYVPTGQNKNV